MVTSGALAILLKDPYSQDIFKLWLPRTSNILEDLLEMFLTISQAHLNFGAKALYQQIDFIP